MFIPRKYVYTTTARAYYIDGWRDGFEGRTNAYLDLAAAVELALRHGRAVLKAYEDGYKTGEAARE
jgi:hypothetical protein